MSNYVDTLIADLGGDIRPVQPKEKFIPGRWPHTYAVDYLRGYCGVDLSRGECSMAIRAWCAANHFPEDTTFFVLALRYVRRNGVEVPS